MSAKLYFYFKKNPLQFIQVSGLNVMINNEKTFNIKANVEVEYEIIAGKCKIQMSMPYLGSETGIANIELDVKDGDIILLTYKSPITVFTNGTILVDKKNSSNYANLEDDISNSRYKSLKVFKPKEWLENCPVKIEEEKLLLDNQKNQIILQIKLFNLSEKNIRAVYMNIECFDDAMDYVTKYNDISYQGLDVLPKSSFGDRHTNYFKELNIANIRIIINKVVFTDSEVWRNNKNEIGVLLPEQKSIDKSDVLYEQVLREFEEKQVKPIFWFESDLNYWRCTCGQTNLNNYFKCCYCGTEKEFLTSKLDKNYLIKQQKKYIEFRQRENEEKLKIEEETKKLLEKKNIMKQKKEKIIKVISLIVIIIVILYIFISVYTHISLSELVEERNIGKIERVLKLGKDINEVDEYGETALYSAVSNCDEEITKYLIEKGANVNFVDLQGYSVLENAINRNNENIIRYLVENKANTNFVDTNGHGMLEIAINIGNSNVIQYLIENKSNTNFVNNDKKSVLEIAISKNDIKTVESLIKNGANIDYICNNNESILANTINNNNEDLVKILVQNGADVNYINSNEKSILQVAMERNNNSIINHLVENGAKKTGKYIDIVSGLAIEKIEIRDKVYDGYKFCEFTTKNITKNNINYIKYGIGFYKDSIKVDSREYVWDSVIKAGESNKMTTCNTQPSTVEYDEVKITIIKIN